MKSYLTKKFCSTCDKWHNKILIRCPDCNRQLRGTPLNKKKSPYIQKHIPKDEESINLEITCTERPNPIDDYWNNLTFRYLTVQKEVSV